MRFQTPISIFFRPRWSCNDPHDPHDQWFDDQYNENAIFHRLWGMIPLASIFFSDFRSAQPRHFSGRVPPPGDFRTFSRTFDRQRRTNRRTSEGRVDLKYDMYNVGRACMHIYGVKKYVSKVIYVLIRLSVITSHIPWRKWRVWKNSKVHEAKIRILNQSKRSNPEGGTRIWTRQHIHKTDT